MPITPRDTPPAICDNCGRRCQGLHQAVISCYDCGIGTLVHRGLWVFWECGACHKLDPYCPYCHGTGILATPDETVTEPVWPRN